MTKGSQIRPIAIAGAGFSGAVIARQLAEAGYLVELFESRDHVAGNCHTQRDKESGVLMHWYGAHIFHTDSKRVWGYVNRFGTFKPYIHRVKAVVNNAVYGLPVNLHTINQFFGKAYSPDDAEAFVRQQAKEAGIGDEPANMEEQAIKLVGVDLYKAFIEGYTSKQWGIHPTELPAAIIRRLPVRFNYDDNYFFHPYQGMPEDGYTAIVEAMLDHDRIKLHLRQSFDPATRDDYQHLFWSGPLDAFFGHELGRLGYRTLDFELLRSGGDYQGTPVINYPDIDIPQTRITEHKHFSPWESHDKTVCYLETSRACGPDDTPYYPIRLVEEKTLLGDYVKKADSISNVTFVGRLGTYRYLDMDVTIHEALETSDRYIASSANMPVFVKPPLGSS